MVAWVLAVGGLAWGSGSYPAVMEETLGMSCAPSCIVCHATASGGAGTANQEFVFTLYGQGLSGAGADASLADALVALESSGVDTDGDGVSDAEGLIAGEDPNGGDPLCSGISGPEYGCFQTVPAAAHGLGALMALGLSLARRRRS